MPKKIPIHITPKFDCVYSDLLGFRWTPEMIVADFQIPGDDAHVLRVQFGEAGSTTELITIHIMDDMEVGLLETTPNEGGIPHHFAYWVVGSAYDTAWTEFNKQTRYEFVTGGKCLVVCAPIEPKIEVVKRASVAQIRF